MKFSPTTKVIAGVVAGFFLATVAFVLIRFVISPSDLPAAPSNGAAAATTPATIEASPTPTEEQTASSEPTPSSTKVTEPPIPKDGDERGCPGAYGTLDESDPDCKKKKQLAIYEQHYASNPAFKCQDGRNDGLGAKDIKKFVPCINSSARLEISSANNKMTLYQSTSSNVMVWRQKPDVASARAKGLDWIIWQRFEGGDYVIGKNHDGDLSYFGMYVRIGATGSWTRIDDGYWFASNTYYQVVIFWNDPTKLAGDAPLPPFFDWKNVAKH